MNQRELDLLMQSKGDEAYDKRMKAAEENRAETRTPPMRFTLRQAVGQLVAALNHWKASYPRSARKPQAIKKLSELPFEQAALIASQVILDSFSVPRRYMDLAKTIGREIEGEVWFNKIAKESPGLWEEIEKAVTTTQPGHRFEAYRGLASGASRQGDTQANQEWSLDDRYKVGIVMIEMFAANTGLIELKKRTTFKRGKPRCFIEIHQTPEAAEWMRSAHEFNRSRCAYYLPMVEPPVHWTSPNNGGYRTNVIRQVPLIKVRRSQLTSLTPEHSPLPYAAVNTAQDVEWSVNRDVFHTLDHFWCEGGAEAVLPRRDPYTIPPSPDPWVKGSTEVTDWKREATRTHTRNKDLQSERALVAKIHATGRMFEDYRSIWFPHKLDFRARLYPIPTCGLTPQGCDLGKSLLSFRNRMAIETTEARDWHSIHGANTFGLDKAPLEERIQWAEDNGKMVSAIAEDPIGVDLWQAADSPWQFLQWCFDRAELLEADKLGNVHYSGCPVAMDATNSGLQLYSLLLRDEAGAKATNVLDTGSRQDIYQDVADRAHSKLVKVSQGLLEYKAAKGDDQEDLMTYARDWLAFIGPAASRSMTKRPVMVLPYGGTIHSCRDYIEDWYDDEVTKRGLKDNPPFKLIFRHCLLLAQVVWDSIREVVVSAVEGMNWLQDVARVVTESKQPIQWTSPSGFLCQQANMKRQTKRVKTRVGRQVLVDRLYKVDTNELSPSGQVNGIAPNFIHSIDAALLTRTVVRCRDLGIKELGLVHDSYSTHAANAPLLGEVLRREAADMFSGDIMGDFKSEVEAKTGLALPDKPKRGTLDPECVLQSTYFFS